MKELTWYNKLLSAVGYDVLNILFGIESSVLTEPQRRRLVLLGQLMSERQDVAEAVEEMLEQNSEKQSTDVAQLLIEMMDRFAEE